MVNNGFADAIVKGMLSWLKGFASWVLKLFDLAGSGGISPLKWLSDNWLQLLVILMIVGVGMDWLIWLVRWRPYWIWFRKKRVVVEDEDFFAGEKLVHAGLYDADIFGRAAIRRDIAPAPRRKRPTTIVKRETPRPEARAHTDARERPRPETPRPDARTHIDARERPRPETHAYASADARERRKRATRISQTTEGGHVSQRRPAHKRPPVTHSSPDIFEDALFRIEPNDASARRLREDEVFNVSNLPGAQRAKKRPVGVRKREETGNDDDFFGAQ